MAETVSIRPTELLLDESNPRLSQPNPGQRDAQRALAGDQGRKLVALAKDILEHGLSPADLPIVVADESDVKRFFMLDGNRRVVALKALENPDTLVGAVDDVVLNELRDLSKTYREDPVESITCVVVKKREDAQHWIELRHTGQRDGAGVVPWSPEDVARFKARGGTVEYHSQVLNFLEEQGCLTPADRRKIPTTSLKRLLSTPQVREKVGLGLNEGEMMLEGDPDKVAKAVLHITKDLASGTVKVGDIYTKEQRVKYAEGFPKSLVVTKASTTTKTASSAGKKSKKTSTSKPKKAKPREVLIPYDCALVIADPRVKEIEKELRSLNFTDYPNAVSVLFRVFLELSVDWYIGQQALSPPKDTLNVKLEAVVNDLVRRTMLTAQSAAPVRKANQKNTLFATSVSLMHGYVHNPFIFPSPTDIRISWNNLQPFFAAIWSK